MARLLLTLVVLAESAAAGATLKTRPLHTATPPTCVYDGRDASPSCSYDGVQRLLAKDGVREAGFTGHRLESALGLSYAKRRWLDSSTGTWLSRDDIGAASRLSAPNGLNAWGYAAGNPNRFTDTDGRWESSADVVSWRDEKGYLDDRVPESRLRANRIARGVGAVGAAGVAACGLQPELCVIGAGFSGWQQAAGMADDMAASRPVRDTDYVALYLGGATGAVAGPVLGRASPVIQGAVVGGTTGLALRESFDRASAGDRYSAAFGLVTAAAGPASFLGPMLPPGRPGSFMEFIGRTGSPAGLTPQGFDVEIPPTRPSSPPQSLAQAQLPFVTMAARGFGAKGTIDSGPTAGDRARYKAYKSEKQGKPFKKFWDWFSSSRGGRSGGPGHQAIQDYIASKLGGDSTEVAFGSRFADAAVPGQEIHQIGGMNRRWDPISRERTAVEAIIDSDRYGNERIFFWDKANPSATQPTLEYVNGVWEPFLGIWR